MLIEFWFWSRGRKEKLLKASYNYYYVVSFMNILPTLCLFSRLRASGIKKEDEDASIFNVPNNLLNNLYIHKLSENYWLIIKIKLIIPFLNSGLVDN